MSEPFIGEIRIFAGNFAPRGWAFCDGQLLPLSQNTALFSLIGTTYAGDGRVTLGLPDLQGRAPMHAGEGPGLTNRRRGEKGGEERVRVDETQMPHHGHALQASPFPASFQIPESQRTLARSSGGNAYRSEIPSEPVEMNEAMMEPTGESRSHDNMQPFLAMSFIIALVGLYPSRS